MSLAQVKDIFRTLLNSKALDYTGTNVYMEIIPMAGSTVKVYELKYLKAVDVAKSLSQIYRMSFRVGRRPENIQITAVDDANSIMVLAPQNQQQEIEQSIKKLDVRTRQVLLNIMVVELTKNSGFGFGVNFTYNDRRSSTGITNDNTNPTTFTSKGITSAAGYTFSKGDWNVNVNTVEQDTKIKVLSQPRTIALENQKAEIKIGEKQVYVSSSSSLGGDATGNTQSTSTNDIGLDIELTPRINDEKNVILDLKFKITNVLGNYKYKSGGSEKIKAPIVGHRIVNNTSTVKSGDTLVIGGLLKNQKIVTTTAPPVLGDIPLIGWLLSKESESTEQTELMIFIKPTVIENEKDVRLATQVEKNKLSEFDSEETNTVNQMLTGKKTLADDTFNLYNYFDNEKYRKEQNFIPHGY